jgi:hypothetical protein
MDSDTPLRDQVIARLMARHGLSVEEAGAAWEHYLLRLRARRLAATGEQQAVEDN